MSRKLNVPSVTGLNFESMPYAVVVFLQAVEDSLKIVDNNTVYKDDVTVNIGTPRIRALRAQGQAFTVSGTSLASGDDYATLVSDTRSILEDLLSLREEVKRLKEQVKGT
jgi:hypothetical protein